MYLPPTTIEIVNISNGKYTHEKKKKLQLSEAARPFCKMFNHISVVSLMAGWTKKKFLSSPSQMMH